METRWQWNDIFSLQIKSWKLRILYLVEKNHSKWLWNKYALQQTKSERTGFQQEFSGTREKQGTAGKNEELQKGTDFTEQL